VINNKVSERKLKIIPRKGEYCLFDRMVGDLTQLTIFQVPTDMGKGVLVTRTADGNLLVGPNAVDIEDKDDTGTTREGLSYILKTAALSVGPLPERQIITAFSGLRAPLETDDFEIGEAPDAPGFINLAVSSLRVFLGAGDSEGIAELVAEKLSAARYPDFDLTARDKKFSCSIMRSVSRLLPKTRPTARSFAGAKR
jgi:glycerol-3-phosphate dehydrogenase